MVISKKKKFVHLPYSITKTDAETIHLSIGSCSKGKSTKELKEENPQIPPEKVEEIVRYLKKNGLIHSYAKGKIPNIWRIL